MFLELLGSLVLLELLVYLVFLVLSLTGCHHKKPNLRVSCNLHLEVRGGKLEHTFRHRHQHGGDVPREYLIVCRDR